VGFNYLFIYFFLLVMLPSEIPRFPTDPPVSVSWCLEITFKTPLLGRISIPTSFVSLFYLLYFVLPPFEDNELPFCVPDVLCQHSEVVLWNLLGVYVQMFFQ